MTNERRRRKERCKDTHRLTDTQLKSRVHTHTHTRTCGAVHSAWKRHRLMRENTHGPLNQNRAKVKHILGLSLACVWKFNKATVTSVRVSVRLCVSRKLANRLGWLWLVLRPTWRMCNLYKCLRLCVCVCGRKFIASEQPKSEKHGKAWENTAHTHT